MESNTPRFESFETSFESVPSAATLMDCVGDYRNHLEASYDEIKGRFLKARKRFDFGDEICVMQPFQETVITNKASLAVKGLEDWHDRYLFEDYGVIFLCAALSLAVSAEDIHTLETRAADLPQAKEVKLIALAIVENVGKVARSLREGTSPLPQSQAGAHPQTGADIARDGQYFASNDTSAKANKGLVSNAERDECLNSFFSPVEEISIDMKKLREFFLYTVFEPWRLRRQSMAKDCAAHDDATAKSRNDSQFQEKSDAMEFCQHYDSLSAFRGANASRIEEVLAKPASSRLTGFLRHVEELVTVEKLQKYLEVWRLNSFETEDQEEGVGLYLTATLMSHSCLPNASWIIGSNKELTVLARARIEAGDEVCISYLEDEDLLDPTCTRIQYLETTKGFRCTCERCSTSADLARGFRCGSCGSGYWFLASNDERRPAASDRRLAYYIRRKVHDRLRLKAAPSHPELRDLRDREDLRNAQNCCPENAHMVDDMVHETERSEVLTAPHETEITNERPPLILPHATPLSSPASSSYAAESAAESENGDDESCSPNSAVSRSNSMSLRATPSPAFKATALANTPDTHTQAHEDTHVSGTKLNSDSDSDSDSDAISNSGLATASPTASAASASPSSASTSNSLPFAHGGRSADSIVLVQQAYDAWSRSDLETVTQMFRPFDWSSFAIILLRSLCDGRAEDAQGQKAEDELKSLVQNALNVVGYEPSSEGAGNGRLGVPKNKKELLTFLSNQVPMDFFREWLRSLKPLRCSACGAAPPEVEVRQCKRLEAVAQALLGSDKSTWARVAERLVEIDPRFFVSVPEKSGGESFNVMSPPRWMRKENESAPRALKRSSSEALQIARALEQNPSKKFLQSHSPRKAVDRAVLSHGPEGQSSLDSDAADVEDSDGETEGKSEEGGEELRTDDAKLSEGKDEGSDWRELGEKAFHIFLEDFVADAVKTMAMHSCHKGLFQFFSRSGRWPDETVARVHHRLAVLHSIYYPTPNLSWPRDMYAAAEAYKRLYTRRTTSEDTIQKIGIREIERDLWAPLLLSTFLLDTLLMELPSTEQTRTGLPGEDEYICAATKIGILRNDL